MNKKSEMINKSTTADFFRALFGKCTGERFVEFRNWIEKEKKNEGREFIPLETALKIDLPEKFRKLNQAGHGIFFSWNLRKWTKNGKKESVPGITCLAVDIDCKPGVFEGETLEERKRNALLWLDEKLRPYGLQKPSSTVDSGRGYHVYWFLTDPYPIKGNSDIKRVESILHDRLIPLIKGDTARSDISGVLRLPGTMNMKDPANPLSVSFLTLFPEQRFRLEDFEKIPIQTADKKTGQQKGKVGTGSTSYNGNGKTKYPAWVDYLLEHGWIDGEQKTIYGKKIDGRHSGLNSLVGCFANIEPLDEFKNKLIEFCKKCTPPLNDEENVEKTIESMYASKGGEENLKRGKNDNFIPVKLPFKVLGFTATGRERDIVIWHEGNIRFLSLNTLRKQLKLYCTMPDSETAYWTTETVIGMAKEGGEIDHMRTWGNGVWRRKNGTWLIISGREAVIVDGKSIIDVEEPVVDGRIIKQNGRKWIDLKIFKEIFGQVSLRDIFPRIKKYVSQWRWKYDSMGDYMTSFVMLAPLHLAMKWRPHIYNTGGRGSGKTLFVDEFFIQFWGELVSRLDKTTAHAIAQTVGYTGLIPFLDEFEDFPRIPEVLSLIKMANRGEGGKKTSGTPGDKCQEYLINQMFWFSSIYLPPELKKDSATASRMVIFELDNKRKDLPPPKPMTKKDIAELPTMTLSAMLYQWDEIQTYHDFLQEHREEFLKQGFTERTVDNFAYSMAVLNLSTEKGWGIPSWTVNEVEDDGEKILREIIFSFVDIPGYDESGRTRKETVNNVLDGIISSWEHEPKSLNHHEHNHILQNNGLKIIDKAGILYLACHPEQITRKLLKDTDYKTKNIKAPLGRMEGAFSDKTYFGKSQLRCVILPLSAVFSEPKNIIVKECVLPPVLLSYSCLTPVLKESQVISIEDKKQDNKTEIIMGSCIEEREEEKKEVVEFVEEHGDTTPEDFSSSSLKENYKYAKTLSYPSYCLTTPETIAKIGTSETKKQDSSKTGKTENKTDLRQDPSPEDETGAKSPPIAEDEYEFPY